jgi:DNA-binding CsgD family transcriptional regulator
MVVLIGREREERLLDRLLADACEGRSGVLAIVGEVGVGKSALLAEAGARAAGMNVLRARGVQSEARVPFAGLFELLRPALDHLGRVAHPQREALEGALALRPARPQDRFAVGAATLSLLAAFCDHAPLLVLIDDVHWLDGSSADALLFAFRRLVADPIAVVLSAREGEPSFLDGTDLPSHRVSGLDRAATAELIALHTAAPNSHGEDIVERLHRGTGGNPLALIELANDSETISAGAAIDRPFAVVTSVGRVYLQRCAALPQRAQDMLLLAAASDTGDLAVLAMAAQRAGLDADGLADAEGSGLIAVVADRVEFRHPLARSAVYGGAAADRRRAMHRALAAVLPDADADRRAWHLALGAFGPDAAASSALEQTGRPARLRSAYDVASSAFERASILAVDERRKCALLQAAADCAWLGGQAMSAVALLEEARRHVTETRDAISVEHLRGHIATRMGPVGAGLRILLDGAELAADVDPDRAVVMLAEAVNAAFSAGDATAMAHAAARIASLAGPASSPRAAFFAAMAQGMALIFGGGADRTGAALLRKAVAMVEESVELSDDPRLLAWAAMGPLWLREAHVGGNLVDRALDVARQRSAIGALPFLLSHVAVSQVAEDRWAEAEAGFHEAITLARETGQRTDQAFALARLALLEARQGREPECRAHAAEARGLARQLEMGLAEIWSLTALGDLELGLGQLDEAMLRFDDVHVALRAFSIGDVDLSPEPELVELNLRRGRHSEAAAHVASFGQKAFAKGQPWALARAARCRGLLGRDEEIDRHFGEALVYHAQTPDAFEMARTLLAYGSRLRRARQRRRAREELRAAIAIFDHLGATPWSDMARAELAATGETARRRDASTRDQLTPQELQVALLLAAGRTTRDAASALFLSPKTIEYHLRAVYTKLGINTRSELTATMGDAENHL